MVSRNIIRVSCLFLCVVISLFFNPDQICAVAGSCPSPTIPAQVTYQNNWLFGWAAGSPPQQIQKNTRVGIGVVGIFSPFNWTVTGDGATIQLQDVEGSVAEISVACTGTDLVTITVTDNYWFMLEADIPVVEEPVEWDSENTGSEPMEPNSQKSLYVIGGSPNYAWTVTEPGFWLDEAHTAKSITTSTNSAFLYTDEDACGTATIEVEDGCNNRTTGSVTADCPAQCPPAVAISYNWGGSIKTMGRNASVTVAVQGGQGPYTWEVSGNGFSLASSVTTGVANTINTNSSACGSSYITVTDACGEVAEGVVRCTTSGQWIFCGNTIVPLHTMSDSCTPGQRIIKGGHRLASQKCCRIGDWCGVNDWNQVNLFCDDGFSATLHVDELPVTPSCAGEASACDPWDYRLGRWGGGGATIERWGCPP